MKITNHTAIWVVAFLVGGALIALWWMIHASFEHGSWYPRGLRRFINDNEGLFLFGGGLAFAALAALAFYRSGWFSKLPLQSRIDVAALSARVTASGTAFSVALQHDGRMCHGHLTLSQGELIFCCVYDEGVAAAAAGKAAAGQFGLIGGLIGGAASAVRSSKRDNEIAAAMQAIEGLPLEQQLAYNPHSFRLGTHQVTALATNRLGGRIMTTSSGDYMFTTVADADFEVIVAWLVQCGVNVNVK